MLKAAFINEEIQAIQAFHKALNQWYHSHGRQHLPWRNTPDAYAIYISEVMLQQTQVKTVLERYYFPFLERFPTLRALAEAPRQEVLSAWQGLGYYSRAANLHKAAQQCNGELPLRVEELMALPGIGRNTAHAIAAFAYRQPLPVMEANLKRVLSRLYAMEHPSESELWEKAHSLLNHDNPFDYNQAMMDIGAMVCTKRKPRCGECPAQSLCMGSAQPERYTAKKTAKPLKIRRKCIVVLRNRQGKYFFEPRTSRFLGGLYHFVEAEGDAASITHAGMVYQLASARLLGHVQQAYSHFTLDADIYLLNDVAHSGLNWHKMSDLRVLPMSMAETKIVALIEGDAAKST